MTPTKFIESIHSNGYGFENEFEKLICSEFFINSFTVSLAIENAINSIARYKSEKDYIHRICCSIVYDRITDNYEVEKFITDEILSSYKMTELMISYSNDRIKYLNRFDLVNNLIDVFDLAIDQIVYKICFEICTSKI